MKKKFKFIDLFSGIGAFHQAMKQLGGECVFASEIDERCIEVYKKNYGIDSGFDITKVNEKDIPKHDVLCGGFPCQAFSKAGKQAGINDARGTLFFEIARILKYHHTKYIVLENVRNLVSHDGGNTWKTIHTILKDLGYRLTEKPLILSPHEFGIPQLRERVFILGMYDPENIETTLEIKLPKLLSKNDNSVYSILDSNLPKDIDEYDELVLKIWDEFYKGINQKVIGFPIWVEYFKKSENNLFPNWKNEFIKKNNKLYIDNKEFIDMWLKKYNNLKELTPTHRKFEWQAGETIDTIYKGIIQYRPSGVRVKSPNVFPALVAMVQIPIIGRYKRRLTTRECARLQSFPDDFIIDIYKQSAYKQFGNSANVTIIKTIAKELFRQK